MFFPCAPGVFGWVCPPQESTPSGEQVSETDSVLFEPLVLWNVQVAVAVAPEHEELPLTNDQLVLEM